jgi:hypothetical protein
MELFNKPDYTLDAVQRFRVKGRLVFIDKANRDKAFDLLKRAGIVARKTTSSYQRLHPEYVEDYVGEIETGFGNSMYQTLFKKLYKIER